MQTARKTTMTQSAMLALLAMCLLGNAAAQALYRWVDKDGKVQYSDLPPPADVKGAQQKRLGDNLIEQDRLPYALKLAMQNNPVILYANENGNASQQARAMLNKRGIPFSARDPQKDPEAAKALLALAGALDVPTIAIGSSKLSGFAEAEWNSALDAAGYPRTNSNFRSQAPVAKPAPVAPESPPPAQN